MLGTVSIAAAAVTSLKIEPGTKTEDSARLIKAPSPGTAFGSAGSIAGVETMHTSSPVL